jgi:hypothetical protein
MDDIVKSALKEFEYTFGRNELHNFKYHVLDVLVGFYHKQPETLKKRINQTIATAQLTSDLHHYLKVACIAEGEDRNLTYNEALQIIGERPLYKGDSIYHFSNTEHPLGFQGHEKMCFSSKKSLDSITTDSINEELPIYSHTCEVLKPEDILDHSAIAIMEENRDVVIEEALISPISRKDPIKRKESARWYETKGVGAINVVSVDLV